MILNTTSVLRRLNRGVVELLENHTVCKKGQKLSPDQAAILRTFQIRMSKFRMKPIAWWQKSGGIPPLLPLEIAVHRAVIEANPLTL